MAMLQPTDEPVRAGAPVSTQDRRSWGRIAAGSGAIVGPLALLVGWIVVLQPASQGPTFGWMLSHVLLFSGVAALMPAILRMRRLLPASDREGDLAVALAFIGVLTLASEYAIDLAVGRLASGHAEMTALLERITADPRMTLVFYSAGPAGLYVGLGMLTVGLYQARRIPVWVAFSAVAGVIVVGAGRMSDSGVVTLLGHALMCSGFVPIGWRILAESAGHARSLEGSYGNREA